MLESEVYLPLNKIAKELGLKESHQYMFEIFNQVEDVLTTTSTVDTSSNKSSSRIDMTQLELTPVAVAHLIKNDFARWQELLCANKSSSLYRSP